ncbi:lipoprotein, partial [Parabacteroides goldsteinii]
MKKMIMTAGIAVALSACSSSEKKSEILAPGDILLTEFTTPFGVPPFDKIELEDYMPAFKEAIAQQQKEVDDIVGQTAAPDFENTIVALDQSGSLLRKVNAVFSGLNSANTNDEMQALSRELSPLLSKNSDDIRLNKDLFARVKTVYDNRESLNLNKEQKKLLEETYKSF